MAIELLEDVIDIHSDPKEYGYNQCDDDACFWCEQAKEWIRLNKGE